jgi:vacuolar-type H+-ATPase subunit F/Vma7
MGAIVFIGDELTAAGFRLTGVETVVPNPEKTAAALAEARDEADLVIITAEAAERVPADVLETSLAAQAPVVAVIPDVLARAEPPDLARRLRGALGIES